MQTESDKLFEYIGEWGAFQLWILVIMTAICASFYDSLHINFIAGYMEHWCDVEGVNHLPHSQQKYVAIPQDEDGEYVECSYYVHNYTQYTDEELMNWNRSVMNPEGTPEADCEAWVYDQSDYYSTYMSKVKLLTYKVKTYRQNKQTNKSKNKWKQPIEA